MAKIVGLDLSLTSTGVVILEKGKIVIEKVIKSKPNGDGPIQEMVRLNSIIDGINAILLKHKPVDMVLIEGLAFMARNTTALVQLAGLNYMIRNFLLNNKDLLGLKEGMVIVAPTTLKKFITGKGNANKEIMMLEVYKQYGVSLYDNNINDAFSLAKVGECMIDKGKLTRPQQEVVALLKKQL